MSIPRIQKLGQGELSKVTFFQDAFLQPGIERSKQARADGNARRIPPNSASNDPWAAAPTTVPGQ